MIDALPKIGAVCLQHVRCGKPNCHCVLGARHAAWYLFWRESGRLRKRYVPRRHLRDLRCDIEDARRATTLNRKAAAEAMSLFQSLRETTREVERRWVE